MTQLNQSIINIPIPKRMQKLPISDRGYPIPWFVHIDPITKQADFRAVGMGKILSAYQNNTCWLCGERLGTFKCFVIGPMCSVNRVSSEPPSHIACATYAVKACPFLTQPRMRRNEAGLPEDAKSPGGIMIKRNPGVTAIWTTKKYKMFRVPNGILFRIGNPTEVQWWTETRIATRSEVQASVDSGLPDLERMAWREGREAIAELKLQIEAAKQWLPPANIATLTNQLLANLDRTSVKGP